MNVNNVELLRRQYLQLIDPSLITIPTKDELRDPAIQQLIYDRLFNESNIKFLPPLSYQLRVLKKLLKDIEDAIVDPEEDVCKSD